LSIPPDLNGCSNTTDLDVEELFLYGGHVGDKEEGLGAGNLTLAGTDYRLDGSAAGDGQYFVEGETKTDVASELEYDTPIRSGIYTALTALITPESPSPNFIWVFDDGRTINYHLDRHIITIEEFSRLPGCPDGQPVAGQQYTLTRLPSDVANHPEGHWGLSGTLQIAVDVANEVFKTYTRHVSYNDLSMPLGGYSHHQTHRSGKDIDFNPSTMKYFCTKLTDKDRYIHNAFAALYGFDHLVKGKTSTSPNDINFPNLHCYANNFLHIDAVPGY